MGLFDYVRDFAKHYRSHNVRYDISEDGTRVEITIELRDIPEEKVRKVVAWLDNAIATMSKGKLPIPRPKVKERVKEIKDKVVRRKKTKNNPLLTGVID